MSDKDLAQKKKGSLKRLLTSYSVGYPKDSTDHAQSTPNRSYRQGFAEEFATRARQKKEKEMGVKRPTKPRKIEWGIKARKNLPKAF